MPLTILGAGKLIRLLFIELPRERHRNQLERCTDRIALFHEHGLARDGDDLTRLLACGVRPRRALRLLRLHARRTADMRQPALPPHGPIAGPNVVDGQQELERGSSAA